MKITDRSEIEMLAIRLNERFFGDMPENLRITIIIPSIDFDKLLVEINPNHSDFAIDRFLYNSHTGIQFGIKRG